MSPASRAYQDGKLGGMGNVHAYPEEKPADPPVSRRRGGILGPLVFILLVVVAGAFLLEQRGYDGPRDATFPLPPRYAGSYTDDWGAPRASGSHEGTDIHAPEGTPVRAVTGGTVVRADGSNGQG